MRILHVTTNYPSTDFPIFGIFVKEQIESLKEEGITCDVFYCDGQNKGFRKYITYVPKLWRRIAAGKYDIIHCHHALSAIILCMTGWPFFKRSILSYQNDPDREWGKLIFKLLYPLFNKFIVKNNSSYLKYKKVIYLPNGCNPDLFKPMDRKLCRRQLGFGNDKLYILYMDSNKGIRTQKRKDRFDMVLEILRKKYHYNNIESVELRNTPRNEVPIYINAVNLHLITSDFEGSPNSVKECMCCNIPVVSTNVGNVKEMIGDINGSYVCESFSPENLAACVDRVLRSKTSFNGRKQFLEKGYGINEIAKKMITIYQSIL